LGGGLVFIYDSVAQLSSRREGEEDDPGGRSRSVQTTPRSDSEGKKKPLREERGGRLLRGGAKGGLHFVRLGRGGEEGDNASRILLPGHSSKGVSSPEGEEKKEEPSLLTSWKDRGKKSPTQPSLGDKFPQKTGGGPKEISRPGRRQTVWRWKRKRSIVPYS